MNAGNGSPLYSQSNQPPQHQLNNPYAHDSSFSASVHNNSRTKGALDESSYLASTGSALDAYIAQGTAVLGNLATQRDMLKGGSHISVLSASCRLTDGRSSLVGTKKRLLSAANTLGLSRNTIQYIERRTKGDFYILLGGGTFVLVSFYFILKWFG
jgi:Golgi SNAP receptor complex protein 2